MKSKLVTISLLTLALSSYGQDKFVRQAQVAFDKSELHEAARILEPALTSDATKDKVTAWNLQAKIEAKLHIEEAKKSSQKIAFDTLAFYNHLNACIEAYLKADELEKANPKFKAPSKIKPDNMKQIQTFRINYALAGSIFSGMKDYARAYDAFDKWINVPNLPIFEGEGDLFAADTVLNVNQIAYFACIAAYQAQEYKNVFVHYDKALQYTKERAQVYQIKMLIHLAEGDTAKWVETSREAAIAEPQHESFTQNLLAYYQRHKMTDESIAFTDELIAKDPNNKQAHYSKGIVLFMQSKWDEAAVEFVKAAEIDPNFADPQLNIGLCYSNKGIEIGNNLPKNTNSPEYKKMLALVKEEYKKSEPYFLRYRELRPDDVASWASRLQTVYYILEDKAKEKEMSDLLK